VKSPSPLLGFNNNVKHKGRVFHIQTEDSGIKHPHVITHLFVDGGRILKSVKTSYAEFLEDEQMAVKVRQLMQEQHKAMFIALRAGKFDHQMDGEAAPPPSSQASSAKIPAPPASQAGVAVEGDPKAEPPSSVPTDAKAQAKDSTKADTTEEVAAEGAPRSESGARSDAESTGAANGDVAPVSAQAASLRGGSQAAVPRIRIPTSPPLRSERGSAPPNPVSLRAPSLIPPPPRAPSASLSSRQATSQATHGDRRTDPRAETEQAMPAAQARARVNSPALELNLEALERASSEVGQGSVHSGDLRDLPPPPAAVLGKKPASIDTSYRSIAPPRADSAASGPSVHPSAGPSGGRPEPGTRRTPPPPPASSPGSTFGAGPPMRPRTTPFSSLSRPPTPTERRSVTPQGARYAPSRPASIFGSARPQEGSSIFGEDLISEKSLDEVILSYLAEDLEGSKPKP